LVEERVVITNRLGLHARAAAKFVTVASRFSSDVFVKSGDRKVNGKSIMGLMMLAAPLNTELRIAADGEDEREALAELLALVRARFHEQG
jgi:phosphocarrier protein HPr